MLAFFWLVRLMRKLCRRQCDTPYGDFIVQMGQIDTNFCRYSLVKCQGWFQMFWWANKNTLPITGNRSIGSMKGILHQILLDPSIETWIFHEFSIWPLRNTLRKDAEFFNHVPWWKKTNILWDRPSKPQGLTELSHSGFESSVSQFQPKIDVNQRPSL